MSLIGSPDFHKAVLQTALLASLPITFADRLFQKEFQRLKKRKADDDKKFIANGGILSYKDQIPSPVLRQLMQKQSKMQPKTDFACRNGHTTTLKNFSKPQIFMKVKAIAVIWKLNLPCQMN